MSFAVTIGAVGAIGGAAIGAIGANSAADTQASATNSAINEQNYQFNTLENLLSPYVNMGQGAMPQLQGITQQQQGLTQQYQGLLPQYQGLFSQFQGLNGQQQGLYSQGQRILGQASNAATQLGNMTGANGAPAQQSWINSLTSTPLYTSAMNLGQQAILANASATGGLRGGNTIATLGYLPQQTLANVMQQSIGNQQTALSGYLNALSGVGAQSNVLGNAANTLTGASNQLGNFANTLTGENGVLSGLGSEFGNLINTGESAAAGVGSGALSTGQNVSNLIGQQGAIGAGATLATTNALTSGLNSAASGLGSYMNSTASPGASGYSFALPAYLNAGGIGSSSPAGLYGTGAGMF